ncbi:hypothetical protein BGZ76_008435 [Entomortierella beljakovae]|nr:hypothetical protein BGZ76_008435 [Entomortierella beljakovae]
MHQSNLKNLHNSIPNPSPLSHANSDPALSQSFSIDKDPPNSTLTSPDLTQLRSDDKNALHYSSQNSLLIAIQGLNPTNSLGLHPHSKSTANNLQPPHKPSILYSTFKPSIVSMSSQTTEPPFPSVQELSLTLSADIEIHRLWKTITEILSQKFHATRITLCLPQDPTAVGSSIENSRAWGLKAHWDYKQHFLDENTVTPKDEFAHQHHRLQKNASLSQEDSDHQTLRLSVFTLPLPSSSSSSFSSSSSSSFSRRRAAQTNSSFSINLTGNNNTNGHPNFGDNISNTNSINKSNSNSSSSNDNNINSSNTKTSGDRGTTNSVPIPDSTSEYHGDYWNTNPPLDGGYSSSTSTVSSYSSSSSAMQASRASTHLRGLGFHSGGTECFTQLQPLEYDPEPLLNERTIDSILKAGKTVVLTREYTGSKNERRKGPRQRSYIQDDDDSCYTDTDPADESLSLEEVEVGGSENKRTTRPIRSGAGPRFEQDETSDMDSSSSRYDSEGSYFPPVETAKPRQYGNSTNFSTAHTRAGFADFVQGLNPSWSQSPAPSPNIIKEDPTINPFFYQPLTSYPAIDDDAFNPPDPTPESTEDDLSSSSEQFSDALNHPRGNSRNQPFTPQAFSSLPNPGPTNSRSLIHVPLYRSTDHNNQRYMPSDVRNRRPPAVPIGIVSLLSDQVPYPPEALDILTELNPFLANQVTNALRLEEMVARSSRWGELGPSTERTRGNEAFAESYQRKTKENGSDVVTPRPRSSAPPRGQNQHQQSSRKFNQNMEMFGKDVSMSHPIPDSDSQSGNISRSRRSSLISMKLNSGEHNNVSTEPTRTTFNFLSPDLDQGAVPVINKQPESCFNLDSTTDEIHRSLNILNLDVTGSATCPLAPQTKRMLGRQHSSKGNNPHHSEGSVSSSWNIDRRRTESSPSLVDTEDLDSPESMWQTLKVAESSIKARSLPNSSSRIANEEVEIPGSESPYLGSIHSVSPSCIPKRHLFSTNKRSGVRRRRKSFKDQTRPHQFQQHQSDSPTAVSPYTPIIPDFPGYSSGISSVNSSFGVPVFSPEPSPIASPTVHQPEPFSQGFSATKHSTRHEPGHSSKNNLSTHSRIESEKERGPLSRHGSGWSFNSDDTGLASPGHEKNSTGRKHKRKHATFSSEKAGVNPFPRTRLLRLIVDSIAHHVFTLSPQTGCMTWLNQRSLQYTGLPLSQLLHTPWTKVLHEDDRNTFTPLFKECFDRGDSFNGQYRVCRFDGQYRWFLGRILPVRDYSGNIVHWFGTGTDIHDQKLAELQLNRQVELELNEKKYRLLAEAIPQIVFTATPQGGLTFANAKWFTYSGQVFEQASGLGFMDHVHPEDRSRCFLPNNISKESSSPTGLAGAGSAASPGTTFGQGPGEVSYQTECRLLRKDGKYRWFLVKCISVEVGEQGQRWFGTCTDINDQKLLEHKLKEAHDAAKKSTESKTRFLSNMSHEIRTPLVGITGMINFLITTDLTTEQLDYVHTVQQSAEALLLVINDILDLSKVEAGMMKLEMIPFNVHQMVEGANELLSTLAIQKNLELSFLVEDDVPDTVVGDRVRLRQVLINIIGNAIKFTNQGEVFSRCSLVPSAPDSDPDQLTIKFEITDTGKGFDESERAVMFKPFSQVDTSSTRKHGGTGLGLVLSKEFVELHGGKISCESVKGQGSKFSFTFVARASPPNATVRATTPTYSSCVDALMGGRSLDTITKSQSPVINGIETEPTSKALPKPAIKLTLLKPTAKPIAKANQPRESKSTYDPMLLRHVTGLKLIPGEMCFAEPDYEDTKKAGSQALKDATKKIERGEFVSADTTLETSTDVDRDPGNQLSQPKSSSTESSTTSPIRAVCTAMTRTESILGERRYLKVAQVTPSNPPIGEPASVAIIAANLPNPAADMKLTIPPEKLCEHKSSVVESKRAVNQVASDTEAFPTPHPKLDSRLSNVPLSSSSSNSTASIDSSDSINGAKAAAPVLEQPRILVIAELMHARETVMHLIKRLVPAELNPVIDVASDLKEGIEFLVGAHKSTPSTSKYNHVIINLPSYMSVLDIFSVLKQDNVNVERNAMTCVITTPIHRAALIEAVKVEEESMDFVKPCTESAPAKVVPQRVEWVFKPLTKAKLYVAFADTLTRHEKLSGRSEQETGEVRRPVDNGRVNIKRRTANQEVTDQKEVFRQMRESLEGKNIRILLAEDDPTNQKVIKQFFLKVGAELEVANDGNQCLEKFTKHPKGHFSLVLCDLFMPGKDGYEATRAIRDWEDENLEKGEKRIPIVALSANVMANVAEQCMNSGFTSYLSKPVDFRKLCETLRGLLL